MINKMTRDRNVLESKRTGADQRLLEFYSLGGIQCFNVYIYMTKGLQNAYLLYILSTLSPHSVNQWVTESVVL